MDVSAMGIDAERQITGGVFCGIDPGREKFGFALASPERLMFAAIIPFGKFGEALRYMSSGDTAPLAGWRTEGEAACEKASRVFLGNGTSHAAYEKLMRESGVGYQLADERMTTLEARGLYWNLHPPRGLSRLLPLAMLVPPRPMDDLAAWAIIRRALVNAENT